MFKHIITFVAAFVITTQAQALFEIRAGYGVTTPADDATLDGGGTVGLSTMTGFNIDGIVYPPLLPFGLGLRYESMGLDLEQSGVSVGTDLERLSLIINYRLINTLIYVGAIGTIGFSNQATAGFNGGDVDYEADLTYTIGAEAGASLGLLSVGAELGYAIGTYDSKQPANSLVDEVDLGGVYAKVLVGFGF